MILISIIVVITSGTTVSITTSICLSTVIALRQQMPMMITSTKYAYICLVYSFQLKLSHNCIPKHKEQCDKFGLYEIVNKKKSKTKIADFHFDYV